MSETNHEVGHETTDARVRPVAILGASLVALALAVMVLSRLIVAGLDRGAERADAAAPPPAWAVADTPGPRLQADPQSDWRAFHAAQRARVSSYGWVDREAGTVQVPVERALELVLERGLPAREAPREEDR